MLNQKSSGSSQPQGIKCIKTNRYSMQGIIICRFPAMVAKDYIKEFFPHLRTTYW